jgi:hypothetical protein
MRIEIQEYINDMKLQKKHMQNNIIKGNKNSIQDATNECTVLQCCYRENKQH